MTNVGIDLARGSTLRSTSRFDMFVLLGLFNAALVTRMCT
jgi:hypothetical protein